VCRSGVVGVGMGGRPGAARLDATAINGVGATLGSPEFDPIGDPRHHELLHSVTPRADLRKPCLVPFWGQTEGKHSFFRKYIDQNESADLELFQDSECLDTWKNAVARLSAFDRRVFVDAKHRSDGKRLADNADIASLEHDDKGKRAPRVAPALPEGDGYRAVGSAVTRAGVAFGNPLVGSELLPSSRPRELRHQSGKYEKQN
jgi:hypothetical protein